MTESEAKAVRFIENIKKHAMVTLDHIAKEEPNVSPLVYKGREEKADTILAMVEELKQYRAIGTPEELQAMKEHGGFTGVELANIAAMQMKLKEYEAIGTQKEHMSEIKKDGWIPIEESVPETGKYIMVSFENFTMPDIARYETDEQGNGAFYPGDEDKPYIGYGLVVNAWMPLPKPYREEEEEVVNETTEKSNKRAKRTDSTAWS